MSAAIDNLTRHPTQLYESAFHALMAVLMIYGRRVGQARTMGQVLYSELYVLPLFQ
ncbi:MAG: hypothetical protein R3C56_06150 [Pirellulaceae bacterium]